VKSYNEFLQAVAFRNLTLPDAGLAFHPRYRGNLALLPDAWKSTFENLPAGTYEMWCHPGFRESGFSETDALGDQREIEIGILTDPQLREIANRAQINLVTFSDL
jgi:predicted glycoside hydrolase/deacetylase ChbG (UPF0249 family)